MPLSEIMQIATFYKTFSLTPKGRHEVHVCMGLSCHLRGAQDLLDTVAAIDRNQAGRDDSGFKVQPGVRATAWAAVASGPEIVIDGNHHGRIAPEMWKTY